MRICYLSSYVCSSDLKIARSASDLALDFHLLDLRDGACGGQALGAHVRAVHDRVAAIEAEGVLQLVQPLAGIFVEAVGQPAIGLQKDRLARRGAGSGKSVSERVAFGGRRTIKQQKTITQYP